MKLTEILDSGKPSLSFEVFPPKNDTAFDSVREATEEIASLHPSFMSVTTEQAEEQANTRFVWRRISETHTECRCWRI